MALRTPIDKNLTLDQKAVRAVAEPVVVNEAFVGRFLRGVDPLAQRFCIDPTNTTYCYEIVGVVGNMQRSGPERAAIPQYFGPLLPAPLARADLVVRTSADPVTAIAAVRDVVQAVMPGALVPTANTMSAALNQYTAPRKLQTWLLTVFALLALALAAVGIYGIVHYAIAQRRREIGVRMALGASPSDVLRLVVTHGMRLPLLGTALGLTAAFVLARVMTGFLFEVPAIDVMTFAVVAVILLLVALLACCAPARRAARLDAVAALRLE